MNKMIFLGLFLLSVALPLTSLARLEETAEELDKRYLPPPAAPAKPAPPAPAPKKEEKKPLPPAEETKTYEKSGLKIQAKLIWGKCTEITFSLVNDQKLDPAMVEALLAANEGKSKWDKPPKIYGGATNWARKDQLAKAYTVDFKSLVMVLLKVIPKPEEKAIDVKTDLKGF